MPLAEAARRAPEKSSVREALGRAYFRNRQFAEAATEFEAVVETHPVNDFAHFCLGRALSLTGQTERARHHLALASNLRPERRDYRLYRERLAAPSFRREGARSAGQAGPRSSGGRGRLRRSVRAAGAARRRRTATPRPRPTGSPTRSARCASSRTRRDG